MKRYTKEKDYFGIRETGATSHSWNEDRYRVALVYPNTYYQGMSNLGFQTVYHSLNSRGDCLCERFFLPDDDQAETLFSLESGRLLSDFDAVAFSVSFENDYLNLPRIFKLGNIPLYADQRVDRDPLIILGGVCAFINPEPLADIVDLVAVGEAEAILPHLLPCLSASKDNKGAAFNRLASLPGLYIPSLYRVSYAASGCISEISPVAEAPPRVKRQYLSDLNQSESRNFVMTEATEFGNMALTEVSRGCSHGCRFCAAGYVYQPPRERAVANLINQVEKGLCQRQRIGLVAAAVADYSAIGELEQAILDRGGSVSVASLRLDALTAEDVSRLHQSGHKTVAIAPEAGSQRMRDFINKGLDEDQILGAARLLAEGGIINLKLYFLIGLPAESDADIDAIISLTAKITDLWRAVGRHRGRVGSVILSVNPFIPKPFTPLQWAPMAAEKSLKKKIRKLQAGVAKIANARLNHESIRSAALQAFLSRGDRRIGMILPDLAAGGNLKHIAKRHHIDVDFYVTRERDEQEAFPWEVIDQGIPREYLWQEYLRAKAEKLTPPCQPGCRRCGLCR